MPIDFHGPQGLVSPIHPAVVFALFASVAVIAVGYAVVVAVRKRDPLPIALCVGAALCVLNEPIYDILGKIVYAENQYIAFNAFGRSVPWFLVVGYIPWVGVLPYWISRMMMSGASRTKLHLIALYGVSSVVLVELVNLWLGAWEYYGDAPLKFFGGVAAMAGVPLVGGLFIYVVAEHLSGWRRIFAGLAIPLLVLPMVFAATGWPLYLALYTDTGTAMAVVALAGMALLILATVAGATLVASKWHAFVTVGENDQPLESASDHLLTHAPHEPLSRSGTP